MQAQLGTVHVHDPWKVRRAATTCHRIDCRHSTMSHQLKSNRRRRMEMQTKGRMRRPGGWGFYRRCQLLSHRAPCFTPQPSFTTSAMVRITQWSIRRTLTHAPSLAPKKASPPDRVLQVPWDWRSRKAVEVCGALKVHSVLAQPRQPYTWKANKALYTQPCSGSTCSAIQNIESKSVRRLFMSKAVESVYPSTIERESLHTPQSTSSAPISITAYLPCQRLPSVKCRL